MVCQGEMHRGGVHALTDVTGFGLLAHLLEVCKGFGVRAIGRRGHHPRQGRAR